MTRVAILGSSGYLGSFLVQSLKEKFKIISHSRNKIKDKNFKKSVIKNIPLGKVATESDIATAVVFLASEASAMMTGSSLVIDGGWTAR